MKQFPRICGLSTVGLIHHQEFDYLFHPFRTDFIGESGSGKSMIADLIQLIFVGSDAFESATRATGKREPDGMVLTQGGHSKTIGYAFLNIEMQSGKYLVVGSCIETGSRNSHALIIQSGYNWDAIEYLDNPFSYKDFLIEDEIQPIERLKDSLVEKGLFCQSWLRIKKYHEILFKLGILPIDLASSEKQLKNYAEILQSFSRGKMLDTQKSSSLKAFLFGNHSAKEIYENYKIAVKDMEAVIGEYGSNLKEIEKVTQKQEALLNLKQIKDNMEALQKAWAEKELLFAAQEVNNSSKEIIDLITDYATAKQHLNILQKLIEDETKNIQKRLPELQAAKQDAQNKYEDIVPKYSQIKTVEQWLKEFSCDSAQLKLKFEENKNTFLQLESLQELTDLIKTRKVEKEFEAITEKETLPEITKSLLNAIEKLKKEIDIKESLKKFADVNNPGSLAYWAIQEKRQFNLEEESVLLSFQDLPRQKSINKTDYLPSPSELFASLKIAEKEKDGFWINLGGVRRYIKYTTNPIFDTLNKEKIKSHFSAYSNNLDTDIISLKKSSSGYNILQESITTLKNPSNSLTAYSKKDSLLNYKTIQCLNISKDIFDDCLLAYINKKEILPAYEVRKNLLDEFTKKLSEAKGSIELYTRLRICSDNLADNRIQTLLDSTKYTPIIQEIDANYNLIKENVKGEFEKSDQKEELLRESKQSLTPKISKIHELITKKHAFDTALSRFGKAESKYQILYGELPDEPTTEKYISEPEKEREAMIRAEELFSATYKTVTNQYIPQEAFRLVDEEDFTELAKNLLPEAFHEVIISDKTESDIIKTVALYLTRINDKNRQLNSRKIQKIKDLLHEVDVAISEQENTIRRIDNFLKTETNISGGYKTRLRKIPAVMYPKDWMSTFLEHLEDSASSITNKLAEKIDLENMMKTAFLICRGSQNADTSINKLLDPSVYYDLEFRMESDTGRTNKGSTGQTYAAIALLCIARLSVMSKEEGKKIQPAVRIMPIDDAEGLGSNYDMLSNIAKEYDYQLISLSVNPVGKFKDGEQFLYMLHKNMEVEEPVNYTPMAILCEADKLTN